MGLVLTRRQILTALGLITLVALAAIYVAPRPGSVKQSLPEKISDGEFWRLITEFSEPGGYFRSDNFVSNEETFQYVIPALTKKLKPGGVYLGVGPDQNFTYILALQPKLAFITDIRRQNMLQHLMYKALFELSDTRAHFLSKLFARPAPKDLPNRVTAVRLFEAFNNEESDPKLAKEDLAAVLRQLRDQHHFALTTEDSRNIEYVYTAFVAAGPEIRYSFPNQYGRRRFPSYSELMLETDGQDAGGQNHSYLASEENFLAIKKLESENRIVPIVGDFAGEKALPSVGRYLKNHGATVTAFYTSNVEFYLFQQPDDWKRFLKNVAELPVREDSLFIRSYFNNYGVRVPNAPGARSETLLDSIPGLIIDFEANRIQSYFDVVKRPAP